MKLQLVTPGQQTRAWARAEIERLKLIRQRKLRIIEGRDQITPPLQSDRERGEGNSLNARLHRLLYGKTH